jgi:formylglycine-generating enzyme required for sulfatase activity
MCRSPNPVRVCLLLVALACKVAAGQNPSTRPSRIELSLGERRVALVLLKITVEGTGREYRDRDGPTTRPSSSFYIAKTETTQGQFEAVMGYNPSRFKQVGPDAPVECVSWDEAQQFCRQLSEKAHGIVRLPTELEWEYACYGTGGRTLTRALLAEQATHREDAQGRTRKAGAKVQNQLGLSDLHGNVSEWCVDVFRKPVTTADGDVAQKEMGRYRLVRGSSWRTAEASAVEPWRGAAEPTFSCDAIGFRVVMELAQ